MALKSAVVTVKFDDGNFIGCVMDAARALQLGRDFAEGGRTEPLVFPGNDVPHPRDTIAEITVETGPKFPGCENAELRSELHRFTRPARQSTA